MTHQGLSSVAANSDAPDNPSPKILVPFTDYFKESEFLAKDILHKQEKFLAIINLMDGTAKVNKVRRTRNIPKVSVTPGEPLWCSSDYAGQSLDEKFKN